MNVPSGSGVNFWQPPATHDLEPQLVVSPAFWRSGLDHPVNLQSRRNLLWRSGRSNAIPAAPAPDQGQAESDSLTSRSSEQQPGASPAAPAPAPGQSSTAVRFPARVQTDFNGDRRSDVVKYNPATNQTQIWFMNGTVVESTVFLPNAPDPNWRLQAADDFTGDGKADLLWRDYQTGGLFVWRMNGTAQAGATLSLGTVSDPNWQVRATGDFSGDGQVDVVWRNRATGQAVIGVLSNNTFSDWTWLPEVAGINLNIEAAADLNDDGQLDLVWQNTLSGENLVWFMNGSTVTSISQLPSPQNPNWKGWTLATSSLTASTSPDPAPTQLNSAPPGSSTLSPEAPPVDPAPASSLAPAAPPNPNLDWKNWTLEGTGDFNGDRRADLFWRNTVTGENRFWLMDGLSNYTVAEIASVPTQNWQTFQAKSVDPISLVTISDLSFSGREGDTGTFKLRLSRVPTGNITLSLNAGNYLVLDTNGDIRDGMQSTITFTPTDWNVARTVSFIAEVDGSSENRMINNTVSYTVSGETAPSGIFELGSIVSTSAPDPRRFNIDLDFRNDYQGFWTPQRRSIAQKAADDWAIRIANEWTGLDLNYQIGRLENGRVDASGQSLRPYSFTTRRHVDDLVVFVNNFEGISDFEGGYGVPEYGLGGFSATAPMPRVGQITINSALYYNQPELVLYQTVLHELGHVLGLVGMNWIGASKLANTNQPTIATFQGAYSRAANGGQDVPLESQDGPNPVTGSYGFAHPAQRVQSVMSYGWMYRLAGPTTIDYAMLADSGYSIRGVNAAVPT